MEKLQKIFIIFIFISLIFLGAGVAMGFNLADIEWSRNQLISENPQNINFTVKYNSTFYLPEISFMIKNEGRFDFNIEKVTWIVYLVNGSKLYQTNNYMWSYKHGSMVVPKDGSKVLKITDNSTTHMWMGYVLRNLNWMINNGKNLTWKVTIDVLGILDNFNGEQYSYNVRTWYLWKLPKVEISYEGIQK